VYVDDIIFGSTNKDLCTEFEEVMRKKFEMSSLGKMSMFLGLQVQQNDEGILLHQRKYVEDILTKFGFNNSKSFATPMAERPLLTADEAGEPVDPTYYRSMIGSLMYLTASRPDIMFAVCQCARYQSNPKASHVKAVRRIFSYLKGRPMLGLWYPTFGDISLRAFSDSNYGGIDDDGNPQVRDASSLVTDWWLGSARSNRPSLLQRQKLSMWLLQLAAHR
jgi:Reverse transcriptase (RNA-dependent DNA polymerase)